ncbi:MAG: hypothetical protein ACYCSJ_12645, partial [Acidimicrobiales bacterium]
LVDKIFSSAGRAEESKEDARQFRKLAGFSDEDIDEAHVPLAAEEERAARLALVAGSRTVAPSR